MLSVDWASTMVDSGLAVHFYDPSREEDYIKVGKEKMKYSRTLPSWVLLAYLELAVRPGAVLHPL